MKEIMFEIPFRLPGLNEYINDCRNNRYKGANAKKEIEDSIKWVLPKKVKIDCKVSIHFIWYEKTMRRDKDNVAFAKKFICDALQKSGILTNDNNRYIAGFTDSFVYGQGDKVKVIIKGEE